MWRWLVWNLRTLQRHTKILYRYMDRTVKPRTLWTCAGVAVANLHKNMWEKKTFERKKRCEEMWRDDSQIMFNQCLHVPAHLCAYALFKVHCSLLHAMQRKLLRLGHCMGPPLWRCDSWPPRVEHCWSRKNYSHRQIHTHTGGSKVAVCKISSTIPCLWLIRFYQLLWVTMRSNCVEMLRASQSHCMLRHCVLFNRNGSLDLNVLKDTDCTLLNPGWTVTTLSATAIRLQDLTKTLQKHPSYFDIFLKLLRIS